jgi:hypothetical protein
MNGLCINLRAFSHTAESALHGFQAEADEDVYKLDRPTRLARMSHEHFAKDETQPPRAVLRTESFRRTRASIVCGENPESPFPVVLSGAVQHGFGRGGRDLGCHTGM